MSDILVDYTSFLAVILNLSFVFSETGQNMVKRCIGTPQRAKSGPSDVFRASFGPLYCDGLRDTPMEISPMLTVLYNIVGSTIEESGKMIHSI